MAAALVTGTVAHCCANMFVWTISNVVNVGAVLCIRYYHVHYVSDGTFNAGYGPRRCFWTFRRNYAQDTGFFHKVPYHPLRYRYWDFAQLPQINRDFSLYTYIRSI